MEKTPSPAPNNWGWRLAAFAAKCFPVIIFIATVTRLVEDQTAATYYNPRLDLTRGGSLSLGGEKPFKSMHNKRILVACSPAQSYCTDCNTATPQLCITCDSAHILSPASTCELPCDQKKFLSPGGSCEDCLDPCRNCWGQSDNCTECYYGLKTFQHQATPPLFKCIPTCKANEWYSFANNSCVQCPYLCTTCTSSTRCTACTAAATLTSNKCLINCPSGSYRDSNNVCQTCDAWCATCSGSSSNCDTCSGSGVNPAPDCKMATAPCAPGYYWSGSSCTQCANYPASQTCTGSFTSTSCKSNGSLTSAGVFDTPAFYLNGNNCQQAPYRCIYATTASCTTCAPGYEGSSCSNTLPNPACGAGFYTSVNNDACIPCSDNCDSCVLNSEVNQRYSWKSYPCQNCKSGYWKIDGYCQTNIFTCRVDEWSLESSPSSCSPCNPACRTCQGSASGCTSCKPGAYLSGALCISGAISSYCPEGKVLYIGSCYSCPTNCTWCQPSSSPTICYVCNPGTTLDYSTGMCVLPCPSNCDTCTGYPPACLTCRANAAVELGSCVCNTGFAMDASFNCQPCSTGCATCPDGTSLCDSCISGYTHDAVNRKCQINCAAGSYPTSLTTCATCNKPCLNCLDGTTSKCTSCIAGAALTGASPNTCLCNTGTYYDTTAGSCQACDGTCYKCTKSGNEGCSDCTLPKQLYTSPNGKRCIDPTCPSQQYFNTGTLSCTACDVSCNQCTGAGKGNCNACATNYVLVAPNCEYSVCTLGQFFNPTNGLCVTCPTGCTACTYGTPVVCSACSSTYFLSSPTCSPCDPSCTTCSGTMVCTSCTLPLTLQGTQCLTPATPPPITVTPPTVPACTLPNRLVGTVCRWPVSPSATFAVDSRTLTLSFGLTAQPPPTTPLSSLFTLTVHSKDSSLVRSATVSTLTLQSTGASATATVVLTEDLVDGFIRVVHSDPTTVAVTNATHFVDPSAVVQTPAFSVLTSTAGAAIGATTAALSNSIGPAQTTAMLVATPLSASAGTLLQKLANFFEFLIYLNGRQLLYPDMVLKAVGISLIPIEFDNYLQVDEGEVDCTPSPNYADNDVSCNILNNFGKDILFLGLVLAITLVISLLKRVAVASIKNPKNLFVRLTSIVNENFGFKYFLMVFEGSNFDIIGMSMLHIFSSTGHIPSTTAAVVLFAGIAGFSICNWGFVGSFLEKASSHLQEYNHLQKHPELLSNNTTLEPEKTKQQADNSRQQAYHRIVEVQKECRFMLWRFTIDNFDPTIRPVLYYWCLVNIFRNILINFLLVSLSRHGMIQVIAVLAVQLCFMIASLIARPQLDKIENIVNWLTAVLFTVYILLVWIVNQGIEERVAQNVYGLIMAGILIAIVAVNFLFIAYSVIKSLWIAIRRSWEAFTNQTVSSKKPDVGSQGSVASNTSSKYPRILGVNDQNTFIEQSSLGNQTHDFLGNIAHLNSENRPKEWLGQRPMNRRVNKVQASRAQNLRGGPSRVPSLAELGQRQSEAAGNLSTESRSVMPKPQYPKNQSSQIVGHQVGLQNYEVPEPQNSFSSNPWEASSILIQTSPKAPNRRKPMTETDSWAQWLISRISKPRPTRK